MIINIKVRAHIIFLDIVMALIFLAGILALFNFDFSNLGKVILGSAYTLCLLFFAGDAVRNIVK